MSNIAVISKIEYLRGGTYSQLKFQQSSAIYKCKRFDQAPGVLNKHELAFSITPLSVENDAITTELALSPFLRLSDVNGYIIIIGDYDIMPKYEIEREIDGKPGSFRGYKITVKWDFPCR